MTFNCTYSCTFRHTSGNIYIECIKIYLYMYTGKLFIQKLNSSYFAYIWQSLRPIVRQIRHELESMSRSRSKCNITLLLSTTIQSNAAVLHYHTVHLHEYDRMCYCIHHQNVSDLWPLVTLPYTQLYG